MQSSTKFRAGIIGLVLIFLTLLQLITTYPTFVEKYYSNGVYPFIALFLSNFSGAFDFSLSETAVFFVVLILLPVGFHRVFTRKISISRALLNMATVVSIVIVAFYLLWGLNYFRVPLTAKMQLDRVPLSIDAFDSTFVDIIEEANQLNLSYAVKEVQEINSEIDSSYRQVFEQLGIAWVHGSNVTKTLMANWFLNKTSTSGWFSPFFHEVHYNSELLIIELPFVLAHEKAHRMGYTSEAEANFLAYLVCVNSTDPLIRYSGYFSTLGYFLQSSRKMREKREHFTGLISEGVKLDLVAVRERWKSHLGFFSNLSSKGYDLYLRANQVQEGRLSYSRVVDMIVKYRSKTGRATPPTK